MRKKPAISVFDYRDYRKFLRDWYQAAKDASSSFSHRNFAKRAGFKSSNFLKLVMDGERNLTEASLAKFLVGLKLNKQEQDFFANLVHFNQSKTAAETNIYYQRLLQSRKYNQLKPIEKHQYEYCADWHHAVIRELVVSPGFDGTAEWLATRIHPAITSAQADKSLKLLEKLGFITKDDNDQWCQASPVLSTGAEVTSEALFNFHKNLLDLGKEVLEKVDAAERDISAVTLGVVRERIPQLKRMIQDFRQEILKLVADDSEPEEVVWLNIQMFPATKLGGES